MAGEFWEKPATWGWDCVLTTASGVHTWGSPGGICGAEAFTGQPQFGWQVDPYGLKSTGDRAFCNGVNKLVFHTSAHQPWNNAAPGMTMGWWGTQFGRTQTWWEHGAKEWISYLSRCQYLQQQGRFVADLCYLEDGRGTPAYPVGYAADAIGTEALWTRMSEKEGRLVLPDGMSYAAAQIAAQPHDDAAADRRKIRQLVNDGATHDWDAAPKFVEIWRTYPACDAEVAAIAEELWGSVTADGAAHAFGKGRVFNFAPSGPGPAETDRIAGKEQVPAILAAAGCCGSIAGCATAGEAGGAGGVYVCWAATPVMWIHRHAGDA